MLTSKVRGDEGEDQALVYLQRQGMKLVQRNYRVAAGPGRPGGEIDLILQDRDGTLVFVEVRTRKSAHYGGAAVSVSSAKRAKLIYAASRYLMARLSPPPCRFDVVVIESGVLTWLPAAFDLS